MQEVAVSRRLKIKALRKLHKESVELEEWLIKFIKDHGLSDDKDTAERDRQRQQQVKTEILILELLMDYVNQRNEATPQDSGLDHNNSWVEEQHVHRLVNKKN